jgi:hypothetical protein
MIHEFDNLNKQIKLYEVYPNIFAVTVKNDDDRAFLFLRCQEYYESDSDKFRNKSFTIKNYVKFYKKKTNSKSFNYSKDFVGFNLPCKIINDARKKIADPNIYDIIMSRIVETIKSKIGNQSYYLIGINPQLTGELINHELAHGIYYLDPEYKNKVNELIESLPASEKNKIFDELKQLGYCKQVLKDELNAYSSTGNVFNLLSPTESNKFKTLYKQYIKKKLYPKFKQIKIIWT